MIVTGTFQTTLNCNFSGSFRINIMFLQLCCYSFFMAKQYLYLKQIQNLQSSTWTSSFLGVLFLSLKLLEVWHKLKESGNCYKTTFKQDADKTYKICSCAFVSYLSELQWTTHSGTRHGDMLSKFLNVFVVVVIQWA